MSKAGYHMMIIDSNEMMKMLVEIEIWYMHKMYIKDNIQWAICNLELNLDSKPIRQTLIAFDILLLHAKWSLNNTYIFVYWKKNTRKEIVCLNLILISACDLFYRLR